MEWKVLHGHDVVGHVDEVVVDPSVLARLAPGVVNVCRVRQYAGRGLELPSG